MNQLRNVSPTGLLHVVASVALIIVFRSSLVVAGESTCEFFRNGYHLYKAMVVRGGMRLWRVSLCRKFPF